MAVVKCNGYGHGLISTASTLAKAGVDGFAVASLEEGIALRDHGITEPVTLLEGCFDASELSEAARGGFRVVVHERSQLHALESATLPHSIDVWLKIDTGMHRLGFPLEKAEEIYTRLTACPWVAGLGLMSHLANADNRFDRTTELQVEALRGVVPDAQLDRSLANSAAILTWPVSHFEWVRPGIMLYGVSPFPGRTALELDLRPVMTFESAVIAVRWLRRGAPVGYGGDYVCPEDMPVGVVAVGYGDGYPRHAPTGTPVRIGETEVSLAGRVSMDMITVDLRRRPHTRVGERVTLWGANLPVEEVARRSNTIPYTLVCAVAARVPRRDTRA